MLLTIATTGDVVYESNGSGGAAQSVRSGFPAGAPPEAPPRVCVGAISEEGRRLNILKDTLREWRARFAQQLRAQCVAANATTRAERGQIRAALKDGI